MPSPLLDYALQMILSLMVLLDMVGRNAGRPLTFLNGIVGSVDPLYSHLQH